MTARLHPSRSPVLNSAKVLLRWKTEPPAELTDTIRWFNASYAVLTDLNGWDYNRFAGLAANDDVMAMEQKSLEEWWSVTDRATADSTLDWILTEGHRDTFAEDMAYLEESRHPGHSPE